MKVLDNIRVESRSGTVRVIVCDGLDMYAMALSPEAARNLISDLEEHAGVADLENEEWKAGRVEEQRPSEV